MWFLLLFLSCCSPLYIARAVSLSFVCVRVCAKSLLSWLSIIQYRIGDIEMFGTRRRGWLRPWVLSMLDNGPKNGADIISEVENVSFGWWRPSPGSIYPLLEDMNRDGLIKKREDGKYEITDKGRDETYWFHGPWRHTHRPVSVEEILNEIEAYVSYFEDLANSNKPRIEVYSNRIKALKDRLSMLADRLQG